MENLHRVIAAYTAMDRRRKEEMLELMERQAKRFPMKNPLTLVVNNPGSKNPSH